MPFITDVLAREVLDSRGKPNYRSWSLHRKRSVRTRYGSFSFNCEYEAVELCIAYSLPWKRSSKQLDNVNNIIAEAILGYDVCEQMAIDKLMIELDGTKQR